MILRTLKKRIKEQNWFAVILEVIMVILGVTLAFQINSWNENRKDRIAEEHILNGLYHEFLAAEKEITADMKSRNHYIRTQRVIEQIRLNHSQVPLDSVRQIVENLASYRYYTPTHPILQDLQTSGRFDLIESAEVRDQLSSYLQEKDRLAVIEERERSFVANYIEPYLTKHLDLLQLNSDDLKAESDQYRIFIEMTYGQEFGSLLFYKTKRTSSALSYSQRVLDLIKSLQVLLNEAKN